MHRQLPPSVDALVDAAARFEMAAQQVEGLQIELGAIDVSDGLSAGVVAGDATSRVDTAAMVARQVSEHLARAAAEARNRAIAVQAHLAAVDLYQAAMLRYQAVMAEWNAAFLAFILGVGPFPADPGLPPVEPPPPVFGPFEAMRL